MVDGGVDPDGITVLRAHSDANGGGAALRVLLDAAVADRITLMTHHPDDRQSLAYLAASESAEPILIHRALHEADVVLPIGCLHADAAAGYFGIHGAVYPLYSDEKTLARFRAPAAIEARGNQRRHLIEEADHVAWLLGVQLHDPTRARRRGPDHARGGRRERGRSAAAAASCTARRGADRSAIAQASWWRPSKAVPVNRRGRTWAAHSSAALTLADDGGAIAVCCDLDAPPGPAVQQMASRHTRAAVLRKIEKERPRDALPAAELARALEHGPVYLLSRLAPSLVEDLDVTPIANADELARLTRQHKTCTLLSNAPQAMVSVQEEV